MCQQTMNDFHVFDYDKEKMLQQTLAVTSLKTQNVLQIGDNIVNSTTRTHFQLRFQIIDMYLVGVIEFICWILRLILNYN